MSFKHFAAHTSEVVGSANAFFLSVGLIAGWALLISITSGALLRTLSNPRASTGRRVVAFFPLIAVVAAPARCPVWKTATH